jgi:hypothetical protein
MERRPSKASEAGGESRVDERTLWFTVVVGPMAFLTQEVVNFLLTPAVCQGRNRLMLVAISAAALAVTLAAGAFAVRSGVAPVGERGEPERERSRLRFAAGVALLSSTFSALVILATVLPTLIHAPCD